MADRYDQWIDRMVHCVERTNRQTEACIERLLKDIYDVCLCVPHQICTCTNTYIPIIIHYCMNCTCTLLQVCICLYTCTRTIHVHSIYTAVHELYMYIILITGVYMLALTRLCSCVRILLCLLLSHVHNNQKVRYISYNVCNVYIHTM